MNNALLLQDCNKLIERLESLTTYDEEEDEVRSGELALMNGLARLLQSDGVNALGLPIVNEMIRTAEDWAKDQEGRMKGMGDE